MKKDTDAADTGLRRKRETDKDEARHWHPSIIEFEEGVEVSEVLDTVPDEFKDLFRSDAD
jgi:hypothetical protein